MIKDLKDLERLLKLCRKQGVTEIKLEGCELKLGDMPVTQSQADAQQPIDPNEPWANFPTGILSPEQLAFYSAGGDPAEDPHRTDQ